MKIRPLGAELFHADRQTDMTKLIVAFRNFANAPNKYTQSHRTRRYTSFSNVALYKTDLLRCQ